MHPYSQRLSWPLSPNSFSRLIEEKRRTGTDLLDLTVSNPAQALADYPHAQINRAYARVTDFSYTPDPFGSLQSRESIAAQYARRGIPVFPHQIALTASTSESYAVLLKLFCDPSDDILAPVPSYPLFEYLARLECVNVVPYRIVYDGSWYIDFAHLLGQITPRTKAIIVVNPNNPTGSFLKARERQQLIELALKRHIPLICDEVFMDYSVTEPVDAVKTMISCQETLSFSLNGLSKMAGMPQVKLGWMVINGPLQCIEAARQRLELVLDTYLSVNTPTQSALSDLFEIGNRVQHRLAERINGNLLWLQSQMAATPLQVLHIEGGWSAILQLPRITPEEIWVQRLLTEQNVIVQPGYFFDLPTEAFIVVSLITPPEIFAEGVRRLLLLME